MWRVEKKKAVLDSPSFAFEIDIQSPESGVSRFELAGETWQGAKPLQIHSFDPDLMGQPRCENVYLRGPDLVLSYRMSKVPEFSWQVYWRSLTSEEGMLAGVELILSVQTDLLDSDPRLTVESLLTASQVLQIKLAESFPDEPAWIEIPGTPPSSIFTPPCILLYRPSGASHSYLEMVHPADFAALEVLWRASDPPASTARFLMFDEALEKGVIRRGRLRTMVLPRTDDVAIAQACYQSFVESAIPLTA